MADVRSLLRNERASRRIDHPHASYTDSGKLQCTVCALHIKTESLWESHIKSAQHTARLEHLRSNSQPSQSKKRKAAQSDDEARKRVKAVPGGFVPEGFFDDTHDQSNQESDKDPAAAPSIPDAAADDQTPVPQPAAPAAASALAPAAVPDVNEDEWAAFEREMAAANDAAPTAALASATISAAPVTAEQLAAQAREEQSAQRSAREAEIEADTEDANLALQQEFDDMEELDERVRRLREKREALRRQPQSDTLPDAPAPVEKLPSQDAQDQLPDNEEDEDEDDDEFDDWTFGAR